MNEVEERIRSYLLMGLSTALPWALITKTKEDEKAIMRWQAALVDPAKWNAILELVRGPKP